MNTKPISPLRYPGGKSRISEFLGDLINLNSINDCTVYELYAGGAGASLNTLFSGTCEKIVLNDLDFHIYAFWYSVLNHTDDFIGLIENTSVDMDSWHVQKQIYKDYQQHGILEIGFSTFFLNRCNRSGILQAGPIGGLDQSGNYKIDVRFNKANLIDRIQLIATKKDRIELKNMESIDLLADIFSKKDENKFIFLDPPYYVQGENLYFNSYSDDNHVKLANLLKKNCGSKWLLTYDTCTRIQELYSDFNTAYLPMTYTLQAKRKAKEIMVFSDSLHIPKNLTIGNKSKPLAINEQL